MTQLLSTLPTAWAAWQKGDRTLDALLYELGRELNLPLRNETGDRCYNEVIDWLDTNHPNWRG